MAHHDDVSDAQSLNTVRQDADRVVVCGLELVGNVPLGEERTRRRREDRSLRNSGITNGPTSRRAAGTEGKNGAISLRNMDV